MGISTHIKISLAGLAGKAIAVPWPMLKLKQPSDLRQGIRAFGRPVRSALRMDTWAFGTLIPHWGSALLLRPYRQVRGQLFWVTDSCSAAELPRDRRLDAVAIHSQAVQAIVSKKDTVVPLQSTCPERGNL